MKVRAAGGSGTLPSVVEGRPCSIGPLLASSLALLLVGCAQGSDGSSTGRSDGGRGGSMDGGGTDSGGGRDTGTTPTCTDEGHGVACESPTDLGSLEPGDEMTTMVGYLPTTGAEDWFTIGFPSLGMPNMAGGGTPSLELTMNEGEAFRFEVRTTCSATFACGDGSGARDIASWSYTDDQSPMEAEESGEMDFSTRDVPWPETVYVRVYRAVGPADCSAYQLTVSR